VRLTGGDEHALRLSGGRVCKQRPSRVHKRPKAHAVTTRPTLMKSPSPSASRRWPGTALLLRRSLHALGFPTRENSRAGRTDQRPMEPGPRGVPRPAAARRTRRRVVRSTLGVGSSSEPDRLQAPADIAADSAVPPMRFRPLQRSGAGRSTRPRALRARVRSAFRFSQPLDGFLPSCPSGLVSCR